MRFVLEAEASGFNCEKITWTVQWESPFFPTDEVTMSVNVDKESSEKVASLLNGLTDAINELMDKYCKNTPKREPPKLTLVKD